MEKPGELQCPGTRNLNLKKSFKLGIRALLTACSKEEFFNAFPSFSDIERERLYLLFIQVVTSLHENIADEFESLCLETQVGTTLDAVEQIVEEQAQDPLFPDKSNIEDTVQYLSMMKKHEVQLLRGRLEKAEEQRSILRAQIDQLEKSRLDFSVNADVIKKVCSQSYIHHVL